MGTATPDGEPADVGLADDGAADDGAADEGAADVGLADDGAAEDGAADEGLAPGCVVGTEGVCAVVRLPRWDHHCDPWWWDLWW